MAGDNQGYLSLKPGKSFHFSPFFCFFQSLFSPYLAKNGVLLESFFWVPESFFIITHTGIRSPKKTWRMRPLISADLRSVLTNHRMMSKSQTSSARDYTFIL